jgi:hypothetical protein
MKELTYKDLKALYKPNVFFEKRALIDFFYQTICEVLPILNEDIDWFLKELEKQSKKSLDKIDAKGLLRGEIFCWNDKYLHLDGHYQDLNRKFRFVIRQQIMKADDNEPLEINTMADWLSFVRELAADFRSTIESQNRKEISEYIDWLNQSSEKESIRIKHFIEISAASTFNHISLVQNKATISKLLEQALNEKKYKNFKKIFAVDPSVFDLAEVQEFINMQRIEIKAIINRYYADSIELPIISNQKNTVSQKPMYMIGLFDSMGIISGELKFSKTRLLNLWTLAGLEHDSIDQTYFNRLLLHVKK